MSINPRYESDANYLVTAAKGCLAQESSPMRDASLKAVVQGIEAIKNNIGKRDSTGGIIQISEKTLREMDVVIDSFKSREVRPTFNLSKVGTLVSTLGLFSTVIKSNTFNRFLTVATEQYRAVAGSSLASSLQQNGTALFDRIKQNSSKLLNQLTSKASANPRSVAAAVGIAVVAVAGHAFVLKRKEAAEKAAKEAAEKAAKEAAEKAAKEAAEKAAKEAAEKAAKEAAEKAVKIKASNVIRAQVKLAKAEVALFKAQKDFKENVGFFSNKVVDSSYEAALKRAKSDYENAAVDVVIAKLTQKGLDDLSGKLSEAMTRLDMAREKVLNTFYWSSQGELARKEFVEANREYQVLLRMTTSQV